MQGVSSHISAMENLTNRYAPHQPSVSNGWEKITTDYIGHSPRAPTIATLQTDGSEIYLSGDFLPTTFRSQSKEVTMDIVHYVCRHDKAPAPPSKTAQVLRSLVDDTLRHRLDMMCHLVKTLDIQRRDQLQLINNIVTDMFDDQVVSWGRIVTLCAFCGYLARYCEERTVPFCADDVAEILNNIIINRLGLWIVANGGWSTFESQFPAVCMFEKNGMWKGVAILLFLVVAVFIFCSSVRFLNG